MNSNTYDNPDFFKNYKKLREQPNMNEMVEKPVLFSLLPNLNGKRVLDLGCGFGEHCQEYARLGASYVLGIDCSEKMLEIAVTENSSPVVEYKLLSMELLSALDDFFDVIVSSLAFHYIEDFDLLLKNIHRLLTPEGILLFSQEHPINTCFTVGNRWTKNETGEKVYANLSNYSLDGKRESKWFIERVTKYHRTFSSILNSLLDNRFKIRRVVEPILSHEDMQRYPQYKDMIHKPDFLVIKAEKYQ